MLRSKTSPQIPTLPTGAPRLQSLNFAAFCARSHYCLHSGVPTHNHIMGSATGTVTGTVTHAHAGLTQAGGTFSSPRQWCDQPAGVASTPGITTCGACLRPYQREKCFSSSALLLKSLANPSPSLLFLRAPTSTPQTLEVSDDEVGSCPLYNTLNYPIPT